MTAAVPDPRFRDQLAGDKQREELIVSIFRQQDVTRHVLTRPIIEHVLDSPALAAYVEARVQAAANQRAVEMRIVAEATDLCWKATPFTEDEEGMVAAYLLPAGVVHRLLGALQGAGYPAAFRAIASPAPAPQTGEDGQ